MILFKSCLVQPEVGQLSLENAETVSPRLPRMVQSARLTRPAAVQSFMPTDALVASGFISARGTKEQKFLCPGLGEAAQGGSSSSHASPSTTLHLPSVLPSRQQAQSRVAGLSTTLPSRAGQMQSFASSSLTSLPKCYSALCKDDVQIAYARLQGTVREDATRRRECDAKVRQLCRQRAAKWRSGWNCKQEEARRAQEEEERLRASQKVRSTPAEDLDQLKESRWRKALLRIKSRDSIKDNHSRLLLKAQSSKTFGEERDVAVIVKARGTGGKVVHFTSEVSEVHHVSRRASTEENQIDGHEDEGALDSQRPLKDFGSGREAAVNMRLELLRKARKLRAKVNNMATQLDFRKERFARLPTEWQSECEAAYARFALNPHNRSFGPAPLRMILREVGLSGLNVCEDVSIMKACVEVVTMAKLSAEQNAREKGSMVNLQSVGVDLYMFATMTAQKIQKALMEWRRPWLWDEFCKRDIHGDGLISFDGCIKIVRSMGLEFGDKEELLPFARAAIAEDGDSMDSNFWGQKLSESLPEHLQLTWEQFEKVAASFCRHVLQTQCQEERFIQDQYKLDRDTFQRMRADLVVLHEIFKHHGKERNFLSSNGTEKSLRDFGLQGMDGRDRGGHSGIDFPEFLEQVEQIRSDLESHAFDYLCGRMLEFTKGKMRIAAEDLPHFMRVCNKQNEIDISALDTATRQAYAASNGEDGCFSFPEVKRLLQRAHEIEKRGIRAKEVQSAVDNGFRETELDELHQAFERLDGDHSGYLDIDEAFQAAMILNFNMSRMIFEAMYVLVDKESRGGLDFQEFMILLRLIRDREGAFAENRIISSLSELDNSELEFIMRYFERLEPPHDEEAELLSHDALLLKVCHHFKLKPEGLLQTVDTFQDLCVAASKIAQGLPVSDMHLQPQSPRD